MVWYSLSDPTTSALDTSTPSFTDTAQIFTDCWAKKSAWVTQRQPFPHKKNQVLQLFDWAHEDLFYLSFRIWFYRFLVLFLIHSNLAFHSTLNANMQRRLTSRAFEFRTNTARKSKSPWLDAGCMGYQRLASESYNRGADHQSSLLIDHTHNISRSSQEVHSCVLRPIVL